MKLIWVSDPHLDWLTEDELSRFFKTLQESETEGVIISGDIGQAKTLKTHLLRFALLPMPTYFVLGNHDIYGSSFQYVYEIVRKTTKRSKKLTWLSESKPVWLTELTHLVGHDGWADGRAGLGQKSGFLVNDYQAISDFRGLSVGSVFKLIQDKADHAAAIIQMAIRQIITKHIIVVTHAPPYVETCKYHSQPTSEAYLPHFCNTRLGEILKAAATDLNVRISVLCGHTHEQVQLQIDNNICVYVGGSTYGDPQLITIDPDYL